MLFQPVYLQITEKAVPLQCVFHSIRFKVNKGWAQRSPFFMPIGLVQPPATHSRTTQHTLFPNIACSFLQFGVLFSSIRRALFLNMTCIMAQGYLYHGQTTHVWFPGRARIIGRTGRKWKEAGSRKSRGGARRETAQVSDCKLK